jgi:hypothetical protein
MSAEPVTAFLGRASHRADNVGIGIIAIRLQRFCSPILTNST